MAGPVFSILVSSTDPVVGQTITIDVYSSVPLQGPPTVLVSGISNATFLGTLSTTSYRFFHTVTQGDINGDIEISGTSTDGLQGSTRISNAFAVRYSGDPEQPFGSTPFGFGGFGTYFPISVAVKDITEPPDIPPDLPSDILEELYEVTVRRGMEGPQVVASWKNPGGLRVLVLRSELEFTDDPAATGFTTVYDDSGAHFSDIDVRHLVPYYYSFFMQRPDQSWVVLGHDVIIPLDTRPYEDVTFGPPVKSATSDVPSSPSDGDTYIVPVGASGAWTGQDGMIASYDSQSSSWTFSSPVDREARYAEDDLGHYYEYVLGKWVRTVDKTRFSSYDLLTAYERELDRLEGEYGILSYVEDQDLEGERFNWSIDSGIPRTATQRFLKMVDHLYLEVVGLAELLGTNYILPHVSSDRFKHVGTLIGAHLSPNWSHRLQTFMLENISSLYPSFGSEDSVLHALSMWLGDIWSSITTKNHREYVFVSTDTESKTPVITPTPNPTLGAVTDNIQKTMVFERDRPYHYRFVEFWVPQSLTNDQKLELKTWLRRNVLAETVGFRITEYDPAGVPLPPPEISGVTPTEAEKYSGTILTITGAYFTADSEVFLDGVLLPILSVTDTQITAQVTTDVSVGFSKPITVVTPYGSVDLDDAVTVYPDTPTVTNVDPSSGPAGTLVTLYGTGFEGPLSVEVGTVSVDTIITDPDSGYTQMVIEIPASLSSGTYDIVVGNMRESVTVSNGFTVV